ncbi:MAG: hypothetical protein FD180_3717 [Planctomycetota bacterium]|nr:MAG: hypothetical protein FD180_3717 [Planctomycetota bacterium]
MSLDGNQLRDAVDAWLRASEADDFEALSALVAADAVFLAPGRSPVEGRAAWAATREPRPGGIHFHCDLQQVTAYGDAGHAWGEVALVIPAADGAPEVRVEGHTLWLFRKDAAGKWLMAREARMLAPGRLGGAV